MAVSDSAGCAFFHFSLFIRGVQVSLKGILIDAVQRLSAVGLQVDEDAFRPAAGLVGLGQGNALTYEASRAVQQLSGLGDGQEPCGFHLMWRCE